MLHERLNLHVLLYTHCAESRDAYDRTHHARAVPRAAWVALQFLALQFLDVALRFQAVSKWTPPLQHLPADGGPISKS